MKGKCKIKRNFLAKSILIFDGVENDFINNVNEIKCPHCDGVVMFKLYSSRNFNELDGDKKEILKENMKGVKNDFNKKERYNYKGSSINFCNTDCTCAGHSIMTIFSFQEIQPARYISHLIGVFDSSILRGCN